MAEPARVCAADQVTQSGERPDEWADVRHAMIVQAEAVALSVREAVAIGDQAAMDMAALALSVLQSLGNMARRHVIDQSVLDARERAAYDRGVAACLAARCRLELVPAAG